MNIAPGFAITSLSFDYSDISTNSLDSTVVTVWSGTGGTGTALATLSLGGNSPLFGTAGSACTLSQAEFCTWSLATASFSGLAESVTFGTPPTSGNSAIALTEFDSITMNVVPVPIPASLPLLLFGVAGFGALLRRKLTAA